MKIENYTSLTTANKYELARAMYQDLVDYIADDELTSYERNGIKDKANSIIEDYLDNDEQIGIEETLEDSIARTQNGGTPHSAYCVSAYLLMEQHNIYSDNFKLTGDGCLSPKSDSKLTQEELEQLEEQFGDEVDEYGYGKATDREICDLLEDYDEDFYIVYHIDFQDLKKDLGNAFQDYLESNKPTTPSDKFYNYYVKEQEEEA